MLQHLGFCGIKWQQKLFKKALQLNCIKVLQEKLIAKAIDNSYTHNLKPLKVTVLGEKKKSFH